MSGLVNSITGLAGVKLFPGGPYPDRGLGDKALQASQPMQQAGQQLLGYGTSALPDLFNQIAGTAGVNNPFMGVTGMTSPNASIAGVQNPYGLSPTQVAEFNTQSGNINQQRKSALDAFRTSSTSRGLASSSARATEQYINNLADTQLNNAFANFVNAAQQQRMQGLLQLLGGAQQAISQGGQMIQGNVGTLQNAAQGAQAASGQGMANLTSFLSMLTGIPGLFPDKKATPTATQTPAVSFNQPMGQDLASFPALLAGLGGTAITNPQQQYNQMPVPGYAPSY